MYHLLTATVLLQGICYSLSAVVLSRYNDNAHVRRRIAGNYREDFMPRRGVLDMEKKNIVACKEQLTLKQCTVLLQLASNVGLPESAVVDAISDALLQGAKLPMEIYEKAERYLDERMACDLIISPEACLAIIQTAAAKKISYHEVDGLMQILIEKNYNTGTIEDKLLEYVTTGNVKEAKDTTVDAVQDVDDYSILSPEKDVEISRSFKRNT